MGAFISVVGFFTFLTGLISFFKPIAEIGVKSRKMAVLVLIAGFVLLSIGGSLSTMKPEDNLEKSPDILLNKMKTAYDENDYTELKSIYVELKKQHPDSPQFEEASALNNKVVDIERAEEEKRKEEEEKLKQALFASLKKLKKNVDDISGITWYQQPYFIHYNNRNLASIYMGQQGNSVWLRLKMSYEGNDWIFFEKAYLSYDGNTLEIPFNEYNEKKTEIGNGGRVWEWLDVPVSNNILQFLRSFVTSPNAKMRLTGKYTKDRNLSANERHGILDVINGYDALKVEIQ